MQYTPILNNKIYYNAIQHAKHTLKGLVSYNQLIVMDCFICMIITLIQHIERISCVHVILIFMFSPFFSWYVYWKKMKEFGYFNVAKSIIYIPLIKVYPLIYVTTKQDLRERDFSLNLILSDTR